MNTSAQMQVTLRLPNGILFDGPALRLTAVAQNGSFGILPNHIDFVTALVPSVLSLMTPERNWLIFGIDEGVLVKKAHAVAVTTRRGVQGKDLKTLRDTVQTTFLRVDEEERVARTALSRLEANIVRRFADLRGAKT